MNKVKFIPEFNIGHVITIFMLVVAGVSAHYATRDKIHELEVRQEFAAETSATLNLRTIEMIKEMQGDDDELDERLDNLEKDLAVHQAEARNR